MQLCKNEGLLWKCKDWNGCPAAGWQELRRSDPILDASSLQTATSISHDPQPVLNVKLGCRCWWKWTVSPSGWSCNGLSKGKKLKNKQAFNHWDQHQGRITPELISLLRQGMRWCGYRDLGERLRLHLSTLPADPPNPNICVLYCDAISPFESSFIFMLDSTAFPALPWLIWSSFSSVIALQHIRSRLLSLSPYFTSHPRSLFFPFNAVK